jgi:protein phosphatase
MVALDKRRLARPLEQELGDVVADANAAIGFASIYDPRHAGMGTTLTAVVLSNDGNYLLANIGDSRTYLLRDEQLRRLTHDHSLVQALIDRGVLTENDARKHPQRSVVLEALDGVERPLPALRTVQARAGDRLLLCSDGVTDYLSDRNHATAGWTCFPLPATPTSTATSRIAGPARSASDSHSRPLRSGASDSRMMHA